MPVGVVADRLDLARELPVSDRRREDALAAVADALGQDGLAPAELGADGDLAQALGLAREQARRAVLVDHDRAACRTSGPSRRSRAPASGSSIGWKLAQRSKRICWPPECRSSTTWTCGQIDAADEVGDPVRDPRQRRLPPRAVDERAVQVHAVGADAVARAGAERLEFSTGTRMIRPTTRSTSISPHQRLDRRRALVFVAVRRAERDDAAPRLGLRADEDGQGDQVRPPHRAVLERDPVVATAGGFEVEPIGLDHGAGHGDSRG